MFSCSAGVVENMTAPASASEENLTKNYWFTDFSWSSRLLPTHRLLLGHREKTAHKFPEDIWTEYVGEADSEKANNDWYEVVSFKKIKAK